MVKETVKESLLKVIAESSYPHKGELEDTISRLYDLESELNEQVSQIGNKYRINKEEHLTLKKEVDRLRQENTQKYKITQVYESSWDSDKVVTFTNVKDPLDYFVQVIPYRVFSYKVYKKGKKYKIVNPNNYKL